LKVPCSFCFAGFNTSQLFRPSKWCVSSKCEKTRCKHFGSTLRWRHFDEDPGFAVYMCGVINDDAVLWPNAILSIKKRLLLLTRTRQ
jgi:phage terminase large subunit-like protein